MGKRIASAFIVGALLASMACVPETTKSPPAGTIAVDGGANAVNELTITLLFSRTAHVPQMRVADGVDPTGDAWRDYADALEWELPDTGQGERVVSVQFRDESGIESAVFRTSIVYDTKPPVVTVTSPAPGSLVDVSHGELAVATGTVVDDGSGVSSLDVAAPDGSVAPATLEGSGWVTPIAAPQSGRFTYSFKATDAAGNVGVSPVAFEVKAMPPTAGTVKRPTTWELAAAQQATVLTATDLAVTFSGDVRLATVGKTVLISAPIIGVAPDGLIRSIRSVVYDASTKRTTVSTASANLTDAFAQFEVTTPVAPATPSARAGEPSAVADTCDDFARTKSVRMTAATKFDLGAAGVEVGPTSAQVALSGEVGIVAYADLNLRLSIGFLPRLSGNINVGAMACAGIGLVASAKFDRRYELVSGYLPFIWFVGPVPVRVGLTGSVDIKAELTGPKATASARIGVQTDWEVGANLPKVSVTRDLDGTAQVIEGGQAAVLPTVTMSLDVADTVETDLFEAGLGSEFSYDHSARSLDWCGKVTTGFTPRLKLKLPLTDREVTLIDPKWEPVTFDGPCTNLWRAQPPPAPPTPVPGALTGNIAREPNGHAWYIDKRNWRHWIPDGGTYECLVGQGRKVVGADWKRDLEGLRDDGKQAECVRANPGDIIRTDDRDSYLVQPDLSRRWIADGGTYECLVADGHRVVDSVPRYYIEDLAKGADYSWSCWNAGNAKGKVVRGGDGTSWYIDLRGGRHWIPDPGTYQCIVGTGRPDYGNKVPRAWIDASFTQYENAKCVQAASGSIIKTDDGDSHLLDSATSRRPINDAATYVCLGSEGRPVIGGVPRYFVLDLDQHSSIGGQSCIIRGPGGDAHFVNSAGKREWIPDSPTYDCEAGRGVPTRNVSQGFLDSVSATGWHYCLNPSNLQGKMLRHSDGDVSYIHPDNTRTWIPDGPTYDCRVRQGKQLVETRWREYVNYFRDTGWDYCFDVNTLKGKIVTHTDGDRHYVGYDGIRHWIPNNAVYNCLKSRGVQETTTRWRQYITAMPETTWAACP